MVEQWSSKSHMRVRFLLSLIHYKRKFYRYKSFTKTLSKIAKYKNVKFKLFSLQNNEPTSFRFFRTSFKLKYQTMHKPVQSLPSLFIYQFYRFVPIALNFQSYFIFLFIRNTIFFNFIFFLFEHYLVEEKSFFKILKPNLNIKKKLNFFFANSFWSFKTSLPQLNNSSLKLATHNVFLMRNRLIWNSKQKFDVSHKKYIYSLIQRARSNKISKLVVISLKQTFRRFQSFLFLKTLKFLQRQRNIFKKTNNKAIIRSYLFDAFLIAENYSIDITEDSPSISNYDVELLPINNLFFSYHSILISKLYFLNTLFSLNNSFFESYYFDLFHQMHLHKIRFRRFRYKKKNFLVNKQSLLMLPSLTPLIKLTPISNSLFSQSRNTTLSKFNLIFYNFSSLHNLISLFHYSIFFKYLFFKQNYTSSFEILSIFSLNRIKNEITTTFFYNRAYLLPVTNLIPNKVFYHLIEKRILKIIIVIRFSRLTTGWNHNVMLRFFEFCTGRKVVIKIFSFISNCLTREEKARCLKWSVQVQSFRKSLGTVLFLAESLQVMYIALKLKDPYFLADWLTKIFQRISFWKFRILFGYMKHILKHFFLARFSQLDIRGVKMQLSGKISVAGNARTRTIRFKTGYSSHSTMDNKILTVLRLIPSFTGVQGFKIWFIF